MALDMAKFLARFVEEARDHVTKLNEGLVRLEKDPEDAETTNAIFRSAHTIKGSARMMKLAPISDVAHKIEDCLGAVREKKISYSQELADLLFKGIDTISEMIEKTAAGQELTMDNATLCEELMRAAEGQPLSGDAVAMPAEKKAETLTVSTQPFQAAEAAPPVPGTPPSGTSATPPPASAPETAIQQKTKEMTGESVRINAEKLDDLIKLMGEIVSNQNRLKQRLRDVKELEAVAQRHAKFVTKLESDNNSGSGKEIVSTTNSLFSKIKQLVFNVRNDTVIQEFLTEELQEKALMLRMVPLSTVFDSFGRMMRDISRSLGKEIDFLVEGGDIELDKKMVEKLGDPLVHMLRNSVDHGVETGEERIRAGKTAKGMVRLSASYDAGSVLIELTDDGRGISLEKIREKALKKNMSTREELDVMPEADLIDFIFHPGFSTSPIITDMSGRGVGLDVVKRNIVEELRGTVNIETRDGYGTAFFIRLPLTLAVMRILLVNASGMPFAITSHYVSEIIRASLEDVITVVDKKAVRLREELIPVTRLEDLLKLPSSEKKADRDKEGALIIIVRVGNEKVGLIVDNILDEENMVIKSLPTHMRNIPLVSGLTLSGKNEIINVLNIPAVIDAAREIREAKVSKEAVGKERISILVVDDSMNTREIEQNILEAYGYKVTLAGDGIEALEKTKEFAYDLIITDVEMPRLDGFSLTERLRASEEYKSTPIIIVTSREKEEDKRRGIMVGADAYIVKGAFDQSNLLETVQNLVG
ncbi:MAG: response regulator [Dissulfurispiraceae bacterium]